mmetsp:Transcript_91823/g.286236  ORF Transcript_91823/g.286236 Transcript_91823/m.286236 type:complete len:141 (+) Transcript_91823:66-488(+)|eukprot:CAMPEP_0204588556 /NCGR_PEP_ID=MMETSP0661-20131031/48687_1 /ASSEMBLY_ACC=CAM_ASM_000606 /TAXON_ID=109239 /ORGANISM="Alexandrium margalefi, Strain AMGDE01CS-322" /LENGTH=140 /DNA_ID=CAMNT_0051598375 /DNA_START=66 /DNA_END=488 /DNA_ORIENTATION=-
MLTVEGPGAETYGRSLRSRGHSCSFVPLEMAPPDSALNAGEAGDQTLYEHQLLSRRLSDPVSARRPPHNLRKKRCVVSFLALSCVIAGILLWGWALALLMLRLNEMRQLYLGEPPLTSTEEPEPEQTFDSATAGALVPLN